MCTPRFLDLKKVEFYQKRLYSAKKYETLLQKGFANKKCITLLKITNFVIFDPIFQIAQQGISQCDFKCDFFFNKIKMLLFCLPKNAYLLNQSYDYKTTQQIVFILE